MTIPRLALRNLFRSPRRTVLTTIAIVFGVACGLLGHAFIDGIRESIIVGAVEGTHGHVLIRPANYPTRAGQHPVGTLLDLSPRAIELLDSESVAWTRRTYVAPTLAKGADSLRVTVVGVDPQSDESVFPRTRWQVHGAVPSPGAAELAISPRVARLLRIENGDTVTLQALTHSGEPNTVEAMVTAQVQTGNPAIDQLGVVASQSLIRQLIASDAPSHVSVKLKHRDDAPAFAERLREILEDSADIIPWQEETRELLEIQDVRSQAMDMLVFVLFGLAALGVANTILMASHERVREIGTLRALGMTGRGVVGLFVTEGALLGLIGGLIGAALGGGLAAWWSVNPLDLGAMYEQQGATFSASALLYTSLDVGMAAFSVVLAIVVSILASLYPARVASRLQPAEAVRAQG